MGKIYNNYQKLIRYPFGKFFFSKGVGIAAPFFGKIRPTVLALKPAYCTVAMKDRWGIRNHIGTINAGAMCSLAELTAGMAVDAAIPDDLRWLPKGMRVAYLKKGKGTLIAKSEFDSDILQQGDVIIPLGMRNAKNDLVFTAEITFYISKKITA